MNSKKIRKATVAGSFYSSDKEILNREIKNCFINKNGPGNYPIIDKNIDILKGVIVPHAGIQYSGSVAAHSYLSIADDGFADSFIIIGPNHRGIGSSVSLKS